MLEAPCYLVSSADGSLFLDEAMLLKSLALEFLGVLCLSITCYPSSVCESNLGLLSIWFDCLAWTSFLFKELRMTSEKFEAQTQKRLGCQRRRWHLSR